jgi:hypothetical protein
MGDSLEKMDEWVPPGRGGAHAVVVMVPKQNAGVTGIFEILLRWPESV